MLISETERRFIDRMAADREVKRGHLDYLVLAPAMAYATAGCKWFVIALREYGDPQLMVIKPRRDHLELQGDITIHFLSARTHMLEGWSVDGCLITGREPQPSSDLVKGFLAPRGGWAVVGEG